MELLMSLLFRPARAEELQHAQELVVKSINDLTERHGFGLMASVRPAAFQVFSLSDDPRGLWTAENDGEIVGSAFSWVCDDLWFLAELFITPRMQGSGIGSELLRRTSQQADQTEAKTRALITFTFNTVSQGLYVRHGMFPRLPIYMFNIDRDKILNQRQRPHMKYRRTENSSSDLGTLTAIDLSVLGVSRQKHHKYLLNDSTMRGFLLYEGDDCIGYTYVASTGHIGPLGIRNRNHMENAFSASLDIAAEGQSNQISAFLPGSNEGALRVAAEYRMRITFPMVLVSNREFGDWSRYIPRNPGFM
jgi:N-acetylglutamate synthase-like GNAT family acetyltransferase